jgi:hypothetical protein
MGTDARAGLSAEQLIPHLFEMASDVRQFGEVGGRVAVVHARLPVFSLTLAPAATGAEIQKERTTRTGRPPCILQFRWLRK